MRRFTIFMSMLGIGIIVLTSILPAMAQDAGECAPEELAASITDRLAAAPGDREALMDELRLIASEIAANDAACSGLSFQGEDDTVLGPLSIPEGIYTFEITSPAMLSGLDAVVLDGECGGGSGSYLSEDVYFGDATDGAQGVFTSHTCEALFEVSSSEPWTLVFEKVR